MTTPIHSHLPNMSHLVAHDSTTQDATTQGRTTAEVGGADHRQTTFLTTQEGRAPSAYHVNDDGRTQRARQEHRSGATVTSERDRAQAFLVNQDQARVVHRVVSNDSQQLGVTPDVALRMATMDGLASSRMAHGNAHLEASNGPVGRGNPHISGGSISFAQPGSPLANYDHVVTTTQARQREERSTGRATTPAVTDSMTNVMPPQTQRFNEQALHAQQQFAHGVLHNDE